MMGHLGFADPDQHAGGGDGAWRCSHKHPALLPLLIVVIRAGEEEEEEEEERRRRRRRGELALIQIFAYSSHSEQNVGKQKWQTFFLFKAEASRRKCLSWEKGAGG